MKVITHEDQTTLKKLIGKTFDNAAIACHKEAHKGRALAVIVCDGVSFAIMPNTEFLLAYEKEHK
jgi:hypothetical protein